ncbi:Hypothetical protein LUCI_0928 [Lucifera butyrica]|uniref:Bacterial extracellular solute-binding protein n=1 Tax=Lucifera butyrica TaxID=1351585 RepID=A0A498R4G6_9FIRM|nr:extracellular solute-binding protein [Lucifera butyrica]VBB05717.1 Hypothetical protein LUCI_0928 [Lucifera butyrica]
MQIKRFLSMVFCLLFFVSVIAGCGNSGDSSAAGGGEKEVHLKIFINQPRFREQYEKYFNQFAQKYEQEHHVKVTYDLEMPDENTSSQILKTRLAAKEDLDIFSVHAVNDIPMYYKAGYLEDLSDQPFVAKLLDGIKPMVTIDNKVVAVPLESVAWGYLYNKKMFAELGIKPAMTLTEMRQNVEKIKAAGKTPFLITYKENWIPQLFLPLTVGGYTSTSNKDFIAKMNQGKGSFKEIAGMFDIIDLVNANGTEKGMDMGGDMGCAEFAKGDTAMWIQGPWFAESILKANKNFEFGVAPLPVNDDPNATRINLTTSTSLAISKYSKHKEVAKALLNYILDDQDSNTFYQSLKFNPVAKIHTFKTYPWVEEAMEYVKQGKVVQDPQMPKAVKDESGKELQSYYLKQVTKDDVMQALDNAWAVSNRINK